MLKKVLIANRGEIVEICVNNEDMVEYGTPLFKIK